MELDKRIAEFHAMYVTKYIDNLKCPLEEKLELMDAVAATVLECEKKQKSNSEIS